MRKIGWTILVVLLFWVNSSFDTFKPSSQTYSKEQIENFIREVYAGFSDELFFKPNASRLKLTIDFLQRVHVVHNAQYRSTKLPLLSGISLVTDYNPNLKRETVFNPSTFNPLKYNFDMFSKSRTIVKVDQTDYAIIIDSRNY